MSTPLILPDSLVLYKRRPARVKQLAGDKIEIELPQGGTVRVRPKDVELLHPGPLRSLGGLQQAPGEVETAWELLAGSESTLEEVASLAFGSYTPATAWSVWQLVEDGLYFRGDPQAIQARTAEEVAQEKAARQAQQDEERRWRDLVRRARGGEITPADATELREVEDLAYGRRPNSRLLQELGLAETPESAHAFLLKAGVWPVTINPYPARLGLPLSPPALALPPLPEENRLDLTHLTAFAIDDEGNQEPDDAVSLDGERIWVHVADVAAIVHPDCVLDLEARERGATLYLPEDPVPMLPAEAARQLGLGMQPVSPALSIGFHLAEDGEISGLEIRSTWVRVERLSYTAAQARIDEEPLRSLHRLGQVYAARRVGRGSVEIELPEAKMRVDNGKVRVEPVLPLDSRSLVREAMLMAGEAAAGFARENGFPMPYVVQDPPLVSDVPKSMAEMFAMRRSMNRSQVSLYPGPHAGLGLPAYCRVTSPLRRYSDLLGHQQLRAFIKGEPVLSDSQVLERASAADAAGGSVSQVEFLSLQHWTLVYWLQNPGWLGEGIVVDKHGLRARVIIPELAYEAYVQLRKDLPLDSVIRLEVRRLNLPELEAYLRVV